MKHRVVVIIDAAGRPRAVERVAPARGRAPGQPYNETLAAQIRARWQDPAFRVRALRRHSAKPAADA